MDSAESASELGPDGARSHARIPADLPDSGGCEPAHGALMELPFALQGGRLEDFVQQCHGATVPRFQRRRCQGVRLPQ
ncbi:MAG: hypothetical protein M1522_03570 [Actinobacteria bacterium]|nr:hypothetical protein [Actinomycetota bacterium]